MSEEQNLFEAVAAPPPPRAKRQAKPKAKTAVAATDGVETPRQAEEATASEAVPVKRAPRARKSAAAPAAAVDHAPQGTVSEAPNASPQGSSRGNDAGERSSAAHSPAAAATAVPFATAASHRSDSGEVLTEHRPRGNDESRTHVRNSGPDEHVAAPERAAEQGNTHGSANRAVGGAERAHGGERGVSADGGSESLAGMSKSRRRRRKRKNRAAAAAEAASNGAGNAGAMQAGGEAGAPVGVLQGDAPAREFRQSGPGGSQNNQGQNNQGHGSNQNAGGGQNFGQNGGQGQNSRRNKKKKFRRAGEGDGQNSGQGFTPRPPRPEPGNSLQGSNSGGMGQRRNRKQGGGGFGDRQNRGPRTFVGPMDHSYREVNGNFADGPASTIQVNHGGRHRSGGHRQFNEDRLPPELMHNSRPVTIPEGAPTHIYFFIEDLFFTAKIQEAAKQQGVKVAFMKPEKDVVAHLSELHDHEHPSLIVFDLNNANAKPLTLIPKLKSKLKKGTSILGFLSHLQGDLKQKAVEAGCHTVMPKAAFSQNLPNLLRRYGVEDEHEPNYNQ